MAIESHGHIKNSENIKKRKNVEQNITENGFKQKNMSTYGRTHTHTHTHPIVKKALQGPIFLLLCMCVSEIVLAFVVVVVAVVSVPVFLELLIVFCAVVGDVVVEALAEDIEYCC